MTSRRAGTSPLDPFVARLYAAPFAAFATTRKSLANELRSQGSTAEAKALLAMKKPSRTAWALNQVAHRHAAKLAQFLEATERVRQAQSRALRQRDASAMREASREFNAHVAEIVALATSALAEDGGQAGVAQERAIGRALHAVPFAAPEDVERLTRGTLVADLEAPSDFAIFGPMLRLAPEPAQEARKTKASGDPRAEARAAAEAKRREQEEARRAAAEAKRREREIAKLEKAAKEAEREAARLERAAEQASRKARALESEAREAREKADRAKAAVEASR